MEQAAGSPLGRYQVVADGADARTYEVHLLGVPTELFFQTRQQHDDLIREFAVMGLGHGELDTSQPAELRQLIQELGVTFTRADVRANEEVEAATRDGLPRMDLRYDVPAAVVTGADRLESLMARADDFCRQGLMLTMPRSRKMLEFSEWWLRELRRQVAGQPPTPWPGGAT